MKISLTALLACLLAFLSSVASASGIPVVVGIYDLPKMKSMRLTLPRLHLYDASGKLVNRAAWPKELASLKPAAGDAFCCASDTPSPPGHKGPPPNCKKIVYGENRDEHFRDLYDPDHHPITIASLPKHKYLIVEYFADWCSPCLTTRRKLEAFLSTRKADGYATLVVDFSKLSNAK